jgi:hypothetical protein
MAKICGVIVLLFAGCSSAVESAPAESPADVQAFISSVDAQAKALATTLAAQKLTGDMTLENTQSIIDNQKQQATALAAIKSQIDALQVVSKPQQLGGDPKASPPESPAKADTQTPVKAATPGTSFETLTELATRLYAQGVSVHMKTEDELKAIDAQMKGVKSSAVQYQSRPTYSQPSGTVCINGQCFTPQRVSRRVKR